MKKPRKPLKPKEKSNKAKNSDVDMVDLVAQAAEAKANKRGSYIVDAMAVRRFLSKTINECRAGVLSDSKSRTLGYLCSILLKSIETGELSQRLDKLEELMNAKIKN